MSRKGLRRKAQVVALAVVLSGLTRAADPSPAQGKGFFAYCTKVQSTQEFEKYSRTGPYADIVVQVRPGERLVFWRGSSYLPYWETPAGRWFVDELVPRRGDGTRQMPDRVNAFSHVELVENTAGRVRVHWRYLPEFGVSNFPSFHTGVGPTRFVDEDFVILPDGKVTRTCRRGTEKIDDWRDPLNRTVQTFVLSSDGIEDRTLVPPRFSARPPAVKGAAVKSAAVVKPAAWWRFDEGAGDSTFENTRNLPCVIEGHKSLWKKGISGTALQFDGYTSLVSLPAAEAPEIMGGLTLEAWIAVGAYPWNWAPIVQRGDDEGYCLGVDGRGHPGIKAKVKDAWVEATSGIRLDLFRWTHVAGVFDEASRTLTLFIDGRPSVTVNTPPGKIQTVPKEVRIGKAGIERRPTDPVRSTTFSAEFGIDALIDEVRIYDTGLDAEQVRRSFEGFRPDETVIRNPDMERRGLPQKPSHHAFQAYYTNLRYYETWDNLWRFGDTPDVVVEFDANPLKYIFWRGVSYIPQIVNDQNQWYTNEFNETWGKSGGQGCQEPMSDKENYTAHAKIVEQSAARVVVLYRVALMDVNHVVANFDTATGWSDWMDWTWTIYPDGVAAKRMQLWTDGELNHEWQEAIVVLGDGQHPEQAIEKRPCFTLVHADGRVREYDWITAPPKNEAVDFKDAVIHVANLKSDWDPFIIQRFTGGDVYGSELTPYAVFCTWNHWPTAQIPSDGRYASAPDRAGHSSLTHVRWDYFKKQGGDAPTVMKTSLEGMSDLKPQELLSLSRSWLEPPAVLDASGCRDEGYDQTQRAYVFEAREPSLSFRLEASAKSPVVNPCFVIRHWDCDTKAVLKMNGKTLDEGPDFRQGVVIDPEGRQCMLVWLKFKSESAVQIQIKGV